MNHNFEISQNAQRLRYEAFSRFATSINKCTQYADIGKVLSSQLKYIINTFILRVYYQNSTSQIAFQGFSGHPFFFLNHTDIIYPFEKGALANGIPVTYTADEVFEGNLFTNTIFTHQKVHSVVTIPAIYSTDHQIVVTIATTQDKQLVKADYKFIQLITDFLANKLSHMLILEGIAQNNKELEIKNKQIYSLNQYLDKAVKERTEQLSSTNTELKTLLYRTTHDFRAPLANILGLANLGKSMAGNDEISILFDHSRTIVEGLDKMLIKLNETIIADDESNKLQHILFTDIIDSLKQKFHDQIKECGAQIIFSGEPAHMFYAYHNVVSAIFNNLFDNCLQFKRATVPLRVVIDVYVAKHNLIITFSDNGQGIDAPLIPKIFDMYYRGNAASNGHGLGLYIVNKLVKSLKGNINVKSELNQYTTFTIQLPLNN